MTLTTGRYRGVLLTVGVLVAVSTLAACGGSPGKPGPTAAGPKCSLPSTQQQQVLAADITAALQKHDSTGFLALAGSEGVKKTMSTWWANQDAIGFDSGGAGIAVGQDVPVADANHPELEDTVTLDIGVHNPLDPSTDSIETSKKAPNALSSRYLLKTTPGSKKCQLEIKQWKPLSDAPYDVPGRLYVKHTKHAVVAGEEQLRSEVDRVAPIAEKAAVWLRTFYRHNGRAHDLQQAGFVTFLPRTAGEDQKWFRAATAKKPKGWTADPGFVSGTTFPLPGTSLPVARTLPKGTPRYVPVGATGGGRVLLTTTGRKASAREQQATLVHEFTHAIYDARFQLYDNDPKSFQAATAEGAARMVEAYFLTSPDSPAAKLSPADAIQALKPGLASHASDFTGRVPTDKQVYGDPKLGDFYYDLAASTFMSITGDTGFNLQCVSDAYTNGGGPFHGIVEDVKGSEITFGDPAKYEKDWAARVRKYLS